MSKLSSQLICLLGLVLSGCSDQALNNPYPESWANASILYTSFAERPKHLDPAVSYSANEYALIGQIYEPPYQYHYLKRPYTLVPLTAVHMPQLQYLDAQGGELAGDAAVEQIAFTDYVIDIQQGMHYQPHPALARGSDGDFLYHRLMEEQLEDISRLADFTRTGTREVLAEDYVYQIKRLADPRNHSPIAELMKEHIVGLADLAEQLGRQQNADLRKIAIAGVTAQGRYRYRIRVKGKLSLIHI